ncbi:MAG: cytoskeletal protein CcmA (bactofilin family) [Halioglobus sp.]|jgi:cytoskeletal protein CcmA (bactofilin family)
MLGNKKLGFGASGHTTLVSRDTVIMGDIHFSGNLDIEGLVQGNIIALPDKEAFLRVVHGGQVEGEIRVPSVVINGTVEGTVFSSNRLELATHGRVNGDVFYSEVEMAAGSEVNGVLKHVMEPDSSINKNGSEVSSPDAGLEQSTGGSTSRTAGKEQSDILD